MATAIVSLVRGVPVSDEVAMTGEITLTGQVLPIGGVREKTLAAQRAGIKRVIIPHENEPDTRRAPQGNPPGARVRCSPTPSTTCSRRPSTAWPSRPVQRRSQPTAKRRPLFSR